MELDDFEISAVESALLGDFAGYVGLAGARRAVEDNLAFFLQVLDDFLEVVGLPEEVLGEGGYVGFRTRGRWAGYEILGSAGLLEVAGLVQLRLYRSAFAKRATERQAGVQ